MRSSAEHRCCWNNANISRSLSGWGEGEELAIIPLSRGPRNRRASLSALPRRLPQTQLNRRLEATLAFGSTPAPDDWSLERWQARPEQAQRRGRRRKDGGAEAASCCPVPLRARPLLRLGAHRAPKAATALRPSSPGDSACHSPELATPCPAPPPAASRPQGQRGDPLQGPPRRPSPARSVLAEAPAWKVTSAQAAPCAPPA